MNWCSIWVWLWVWVETICPKNFENSRKSWFSSYDLWARMQFGVKILWNYFHWIILHLNDIQRTIKKEKYSKRSSFLKAVEPPQFSSLNFIKIQTENSYQNQLISCINQINYTRFMCLRFSEKMICLKNKLPLY